MIKLKLFIFFTLLLQLGTANAVSFDCSKAKSYPEKLICKNSELSSMDDDLNAFYKEARNKFQNEKQFKKLTTELWNKREKCTTEICVREWYSDAFVFYGELINDNKKNQSELLSKQHSFIEIVSKAQRDSANAKNDMVRGGIKSIRDDDICKLLGSQTIKNWTGVVKNLDANGDGWGILEVEIAHGITLQTNNNSFTDINENTLINPASDLFQKASSLSIGQSVVFSGSFISKYGQCALERSVTLNGGLSSPEFIFKFSDISRGDENTSYNLEEVTREQELLLREMKNDMKNDMKDEDGIKVVSDMKKIYAIKNISPVIQWACVEKWGLYNIDKAEEKGDEIILNLSAYVNENYKQVLRATFNDKNLSKLIPRDRSNIKNFFAPNNTYFITYAACSNKEDKLVDAYLFMSNKEKESLSPDGEKTISNMKNKMAEKGYY
ncbi:hypothetical protein ABNN16_001103 [Salmonella enterica subsp. enterica serovar Braenderup]